MIDVGAISGGISRTIVQFNRLGPTPALLVQDSGPSARTASGVMTPGTYRLQLKVQGGHSGSGTGSGGGPYNVTLAIPAPATVGVLGLAGLGAVRRRRGS